MEALQFTFRQAPEHYWIVNPDGTLDLMKDGARTPVTNQDGTRYIAPSMPITGVNLIH